MKYEYLIFDADHTVIDFNEDERRAFRKSFSAVGLTHGEDVVQACWEYSAKNWGDLGLNDVHLPFVQQNYHAMYHEHVRCLYRWIDERFGLNDQADVARDVFEEALCLPAHYIDGADGVLRELSKKYRICIATNGLTRLQRGRLQALDGVIYRLYISEEMGAIKPQREFFEYVLRDLAVEKEKCLMVGDSLSSDVKGALQVGMPCVWFNKDGARTLPTQLKGEVGEVTALRQLFDLL